jgi:L-ribulose-5-phosphate 4-epimerase
MLETLKEQLLALHLELPNNNLVAWTSGNVSLRDPESGRVLIKPSGVRYEDLRADQMLVLDLDGQILEGNLKPSSDTASHLYIYRHRPDVGGIVHTLPSPRSTGRSRSISPRRQTSSAERFRAADLR